MRLTRCAAACSLLLAATALSAAGKPVKVFLLVGQSNMEGKGRVRHIESLLADPSTPAEEKAQFQHLMKDGKHVVRKDVWIWYLDRAGDLTVGFGNARDASIGPELGFGHVIGDHFDEQVLLIKCAWGGKSVRRDFRSPSNPPTRQELEEALAGAKRKNPDATMEEVKASYGRFYRETVKLTKGVLADIKTHFPAYQGQGHELAGMVWFQGWNDLVGGGNPQYAEQLASFIRDIRKDLNAPNLPVVIGESGHGGKITEEKKGGGMDIVRRGQAAVAKMPEFKGTVAFAQTHQFHIPRLAELSGLYSKCKKAVYLERRRIERETGQDFKKIKLTTEETAKFWVPWEQVKDEWAKVGGDAGYHFFGSGKVFYQMGDAFGQEMVKLLK